MEILGDFKTSVERALEEIEPQYKNLRGLVICGTHSPVVGEVSLLIEKIKYARLDGKPYLGICYGHQLAAVEYARNVLGIGDATSEELGEGTHVVKKRADLNVGLRDGETYWNNYEVVIETKHPTHFITTQFHPEYQSSIGKPHPILKEFIELCKSR